MPVDHKQPGGAQREQDLQGLVVLITRPQQQAQQTDAVFSRFGARCEQLPVLDIRELDAVADDDPTLQQQFAQLAAAQFQHVIFISANAAHAAAKQLQQRGIKLNPQKTCCWAIGEATRAALQDYAIEAQVAPGSYNSEALLASPELQALQAQRVLIFRGRGGRKHLASVLAQRGAAVEYAEVYERCAILPPPGALRSFLQHNKDIRQTVLLVMSVDSLDALLDYAEHEACVEHIKAYPVLVPGQRVAAAATAAGFTRVIAADSAATPALLQTLRQWYPGEKNGTATNK